MTESLDKIEAALGYLAENIAHYRKRRTNIMKDIQNLKRMAAVMTALAMVAITVTGCSKSAANESETENPKTEAVDNGLAAPEGIEAVATATAADGAVAVTWSAVDGALKYDVYGAGVHIVTTDTKYTFDSLVPGEYNVRVIALGGPRSSEASRVTFVVADGGAVETTAVDVPETKAESKSDSKKADSTTNTDKAKSTAGSGSADTGNSNSNLGSGKNTNSDKNNSNPDASKDTGAGNSNSNTGNNGTGNNANTGNNGGGKDTGMGNSGSGSGTTTPKPPADPNAGKTWVPEKVIEHPATYKTVFHDGVWTNGTKEYGYSCNGCETNFWGSTAYDDVRAHVTANRHGGWHSAVRTVGAGWITEPREETVIDQPAWTEVIPGYWK
jgi:hypothetical protein